MNVADYDITSPRAYTNPEQLHRDYALFRREAPVAWIDQEPYRPFWAVLRHADIIEVELQNERFINEPRANLIPRDVEEDTIRRLGSRTRAVRTIIDMDEPDHRKYRAVTRSWFMGAGVARFQGHVDLTCERWLDRMRELGGRCDFARDIANFVPLYVILGVLGFPEEDGPFILRTTQALFGASDPDMRTADDGGVAAYYELLDYLGRVVADRRARPTEDLSSVIANGLVDGAPMAMLETLSYLMIAATAGHETTSSAIAGGLLALMDHPDQMRLLREQPELWKTAAEEVVRWVTPARHQMRTATEDYVLRGQQIRKGDSLAMYYLSANRDEDVFENPFAFDATRPVGKHLAFGIGTHLCLGRLLALMEIRTFFTQLLARLDHIELESAPVWVESNFVTGLKRMQVSYRMQ